MDKLDWQYQTHLRARYLFEQMSEMLKSAPSEEAKEAFLSSADNFYLQKLNEIYTDDFQLAVLMDKSDLMFHAQGDAAHHNSPDLSAINWLTSKAQSCFRSISHSYLSKYLEEKESKTISKNVHFRFNGYAPGSIYLGFSVEPIHSHGQLFDSNDAEDPTSNIRDLITNLSNIPKYIINGKVDKRAILEIIDDPAMRDTALRASYQLSPNGKNGIDELSIANHNRDTGLFTQVTKRQFKEAIEDPLSSVSQFGSFEGEIRQIDLDKNRFELRNVPTIGTIRCLLPDSVDGTKVIGEYCKVSGEYETNKNGRPSLLVVSDIIVKTPLQQELQ